MGSIQKIAIVIPCFNEANRLDGTAILQFAQNNSSTYFILVDDGSSDETASLIREIHLSNESQIIPVSLEENKGKAEAVRQGFLKAFTADFDVIGYWDADLATPLYEINNLRKDFDSPTKTMVLGSRVRLLSRRIERKTTRHYLGRLFATVVSLILRIAIYDTQCGAKLFRNNGELKAIFSTPFSVRWIFDVEILARYILISRRVGIAPIEETAVECPLMEWQDVAGSKVKSMDFIKALAELFRIGLFLYMPGAKNRADILLSAAR